MKAEPLVALFIWASIVIVYSLDLWIRPDAFLRRHQRIRASARSSWWGFLIRNVYFRAFDKNPQLEMTWARITFLLIYAALIFIGFTLIMK